MHQVLERFHAREGRAGTLVRSCSGCSTRAGGAAGFGDSEEERQLRGKAAAALTRYHERFQSQESEPVWFERQFTFKLGPHLLRGRVDRVDRLPGGEYELIDYKTGRPKIAGAARRGRAAVAVRGGRARGVEPGRLAAGLLLRARRREGARVAARRRGSRGVDPRRSRSRSPRGSSSQGFEPTPSFAACSMCDYRLVCPAAER